MRQSIVTIAILLLAGQAQASVTISAGGNIDIAPPARSVGSISADAGGALLIAPPGRISIGGNISIAQPTISVGNISAGGSRLIAQPGQISIGGTLPVLPAVNYPQVLNTNVYGSLNYSTWTASGFQNGSFSESLVSNQGALTGTEFARQGFGYSATAHSEVDSLRAKAGTTFLTSPNAFGGSSASATASFSDWFVISGGTGWGYAGIDAISTGSLAGGGTGWASSSFNISYSAQNYCSWWTSCEPWQANQTVIAENHSVEGRRTRSSQDFLSGEFAFAFDQPFQLSSSLTVSVSNGGSADYFSTATLFGFYLPGGAELHVLADNLSPVPEPSSWAMLMAGLGLLELRRRKRV